MYGGNDNAYNYPNDPVNATDLTGMYRSPTRSIRVAYNRLFSAYYKGLGNYRHRISFYLTRDGTDRFLDVVNAIVGLIAVYMGKHIGAVVAAVATLVIQLSKVALAFRDRSSGFEFTTRRGRALLRATITA